MEPIAHNSKFPYLKGGGVVVVRVLKLLHSELRAFTPYLCIKLCLLYVAQSILVTSSNWAKRKKKCSVFSSKLDMFSWRLF